MGRANDERFYRAGMSHIMEIVEVAGIEAAKKELRSRGVKEIEPIPGLTTYKRAVLGRECAQTELNLLSVAIAMTVWKDMGLPYSDVTDFLKFFNDRSATYRVDYEQLIKDEKELEAHPGIELAVRKYMENAKID